MIGATADAIDKAVDRERFREAMTKIGLATPKSRQVKTLPTRSRRWTRSACPSSSARPSPWAGSGGGIAYTKAELIEIVERGIDASPPTKS